MPPKKEKQSKKKDSIVRIDFTRHDAALKDIEIRHAQEAEESAMLAAELKWLEEEELELEEYEDDSSEIQPSFDTGRINLSFPETIDEFADLPQCFPPSYYTISSKERLLLLYAENFRKQFVTKNPTRRALVLALPNECNVQKLVCSTIRPTAFFYTELISDLEKCASFVADFITYEALEDPTKFPTRLFSPDTTLRRRRGNSFEMATLLCSLLIGAGFDAVVVSGVARAPIVLNDQQNVTYPYEIVEPRIDDGVDSSKKAIPKYKIRALPDLESHLNESMAEVLKQKEEEEQRIIDEAFRLEQEALEIRAVDKYHFRRSHAWVAVINNASSSIKSKKSYVKPNDDMVEKPPTPLFIEPATGFLCENNCKQYILVDSVWNHRNYYVNRQSYKRVSEIRWDFQNTEDWEHLLLAEPPEMRVYSVSSEENIGGIQRPIKEEKHLDTIRSWVLRLHIGLKDLEERFPKLEKSVRYSGVIQERFSPYSQRDGRAMEITKFSDEKCTQPLKRWTYFKNRKDFLKQIVYSFETSQTEEYFQQGRNDSLKYIKYGLKPNEATLFNFYPEPRVDSLKYMEVHDSQIILRYGNRNDFCNFQAFEFIQRDQTLKKITEKFGRNTIDEIPPGENIAERIFDILSQKIIVKFHFDVGALTASNIEYEKPAKPGYGEELKFDSNLVKIYKANITDPDRTPLELHRLLLDQLQCEERKKKQFERIMEETNNIRDLRKQEMREPVLLFRIFDPLRNAAARTLLIAQDKDEQAYKQLIATKPADFLAPYLVPYKGRTLTYEESCAAYNACLNEMKNRFVALLNDLQRQYEDLTTEAKSLKQFLSKFENQFDNYDYEHLVKNAKAIELNKRMVQQRLTLTHEESQKKYESVKDSLMNDKRLNLMQGMCPKSITHI